MEMPKPTPEHAKLERLAGKWEGEEVMHPSQWDPNGGTAIARMKSRMGLNGFAMISDYEQERDGRITFSGHSVFTYNPKDSLYVLHWFDCMGSPPEVFVGRFDADVLTVSHGGPGMHARLTYDLSNPRELRSGMEMSRDGATWHRLFDGRYSRI